MAGWSSPDREYIEWDGTIKAKYFEGDGSKLTNVSAAAAVGTTPNTEFNTGSDATGSDGDANRILTLANSSLSSNEQVTVDTTVLEKDTHYTVNHLAASTTVTFTGKLWDTQRIVTRYFT